MTPQNARKLDPVQWLPAERLGQLDIEARMRPWLIGKGLLSVGDVKQDQAEFVAAEPCNGVVLAHLGGDHL